MFLFGEMSYAGRSLLAVVIGCVLALKVGGRLLVLVRPLAAGDALGRRGRDRRAVRCSRPIPTIEVRLRPARVTRNQEVDPDDHDVHGSSRACNPLEHLDAHGLRATRVERHARRRLAEQVGAHRAGHDLDHFRLAAGRPRADAPAGGEGVHDVGRGGDRVLARVVLQLPPRLVASAADVAATTIKRATSMAVHRPRHGSRARERGRSAPEDRRSSRSGGPQRTAKQPTTTPTGNEIQATRAGKASQRSQASRDGATTRSNCRRAPARFRWRPNWPKNDPGRTATAPPLPRRRRPKPRPRPKPARRRSPAAAAERPRRLPSQRSPARRQRTQPVEPSRGSAARRVTPPTNPPNAPPPTTTPPRRRSRQQPRPAARDQRHADRSIGRAPAGSTRRPNWSTRSTRCRSRSGSFVLAAGVPARARSPR